MIRFILWFTPLIFTLACTPNASDEVTLMTYNIRLDHAGDNEDNWHQRKTDLVDYVKNESPDFLGVQEAMSHQMRFIDSSLQDYAYIGVGRDDGKQAGEYSAIFYNMKKWTVGKSNTFWLSESPEQPSLGWDANIKRVCTYGIFEDKTNHKLAVFNTHFDHQGKMARKGSVDLLSERVPQLAGDLPYVLMGDFNFSPDDPLYQQITDTFEDSYISNDKTASGTFNGFHREVENKRRIDYIFLAPENMDVLDFNIEQPKTKSGRQLSDHFPVFVKLKL